MNPIVTRNADAEINWGRLADTKPQRPRGQHIIDLLIGSPDAERELAEYALDLEEELDAVRALVAAATAHCYKQHVETDRLRAEIGRLREELRAALARKAAA